MGSNYTCIIVDDEKDALELLSERIMLLHNRIQVEGLYRNWETALVALKTHSFDVVFMDISIPGKNGINLLQLIPGLESEVIFVTAHEEYARHVFRFSTAGFLVKPVDDIELSEAIDRAIKRIETKRLAKQSKTSQQLKSAKIGIPNNNGIDSIDVDDILYLESMNKCTRVVTVKGEYISSHNLGKFKELTDKYSFFQVHRSYIINLHRIVRYEKEGILIMPDKREIPVAKPIRHAFLLHFERIF